MGRMQQPPEKFVEFGKKLAKFGPLRFQFLIIAVGVLGGIPLQMVVSWRGTEPGPIELVLRAILVFSSLGVGLAVVFWLVHRTKVD
jgi:hypothetical protein